MKLLDESSLLGRERSIADQSAKSGFQFICLTN